MNPARYIEVVGIPARYVTIGDTGKVLSIVPNGDGYEVGSIFCRRFRVIKETATHVTLLISVSRNKRQRQRIARADLNVRLSPAGRMVVRYIVDNKRGYNEQA
ncbi:hypothetical protein [Ensifer sp. ZNC0028]|uniref:hypothetical protein n=1 Tax=Ensifer sp. ZNC0028 TaxID=1339236 RepID=UPI0005BAF491|nr:hypothetical protein [Ensifer sp. ZNC0028]